MDDKDYFYEMNRCINAVESFFDVLRVILKRDLFWEIRSSSMSYLFSEMEENLEAIKWLNKETYERLEELKKLTPQ
jgi:NTP pyrophosphatase (non-canonical NTP hydrolase)